MISVVVNTYNAEQHLKGVLESVKDFDEIVICDMESTDHTLDIAKEYGCKIVCFPKQNYTIVEPARNFAIQQASHEWVLVVDADEIVPSTLKQYLYDITSDTRQQVHGVYIPRRNYFMGTFMHSLYPDYIQLLRRIIPGQLREGISVLHQSAASAFELASDRVHRIRIQSLEADVQRNKIRLQVLPLLKTLNPAVADNIYRTAENLLEAQALIDGIVDVYKDCNSLDLRELEKYGSSKYIVFEWLKKYGFNGSQVQQITSAETGSIFHSPLGYDLLVDRDRLMVEPAFISQKPWAIPEEGTFILDERRRFSVRKAPVYISQDPDKATVDASKVVFPLTLRRVENGDWMIPYGMKGRKLLSDLMTDRKMSLFEKRKQLVVVDAQGGIVWLVGIRTDQRVAVSDNTETVLELFISERSS